MKILIKISGSISAYKVCSVISALVKEGNEVKVAASESALNFIGEASLEALSNNKVFKDDFEAGRRLDHIYLNDWADLVVLAPASAQTINAIASGVGSSCLTTLFLSRKSETPYLIFPAMNPRMWESERVKDSVRYLEQLSHVEVISPNEGVMACGHIGLGRLVEPFKILDQIYSIRNKDLNKVLITLGGTFESIDGVREISNFSSGKTGLELIKELKKYFYVDVLASKKTAALFEGEYGFNITYFSGVDDLYLKMKTKLKASLYKEVFHLAAVSDYKLKNIADSKMDSSINEIKINLIKAPKILNKIKEWSLNKNIMITSFKLTHKQSEEAVRQKITNQFLKSGSSRIVHNELDEIANEVHKFRILDKNLKIVESGDSKQLLVKSLIEGSL